MDRSDGRRRTPQGQQKARKLVIELRTEGLSNQEVAKRAGLSVSHASKIWQGYKKEGKSAIRRRKRGRRWGDQRTLSPAQEMKVHKQLMSSIDRNGFPILWTHEEIGLLIRQLCKVDMPIRTVREYLKRWDFTSQKPVKMISDRNSQTMNDWLRTVYPALVSRTKEEKAEILWASERVFETCTFAIRRSLSTGRKEIVRLPFTKTRDRMVSVVSNRGRVWFTMRRAFSGSIFPYLIAFMRNLPAITGKKKLFVILDNFRSHHNKDVDKFLEKHKENIEIFHLPPKSNESNAPMA